MQLQSDRADGSPTAEPSFLGRRLLRGALAGLVAGWAFIGINMWYADSQGQPLTAPFELISSILLGQDALAAGDTNVALGMVIHSVLSVGFGLALAVVSPMARTNGTMAAFGAVYGIGLFLLNFIVLAQTVLPQFTNPNLPLEFAAHVVFGVLLALMFFSTDVRRQEPIVAVGT